MLNTLVHNQPVNKGLHWAMFVPSVVNGPQRTLVNFYFMHKGVMDEPM